MPRKTRKQKEKANARRAVRSASDTPGTNAVKGEFEFQFRMPASVSKKIDLQKNSDNSVRFKDTGTTGKDLTKTLVLALAIFALELVIYSRWFN